MIVSPIIIERVDAELKEISRQRHWSLIQVFFFFF